MARKPKLPPGVQKQGKGYRIRWREKGRRCSETFPDAQTAEKALKIKLGNIAAGRAGIEVERPAGPPLSKLAEDWLTRREQTHRAWRDDRNRWTRHLKPTLGHLRPEELDQAAIRRLVEAKLAEGLSSTSCKHLVRLLSTFFSDLVEQKHAETNPAKGLPVATRRLIKEGHNPEETPYLARQEDVARVVRQLAAPWSVLYAVTALAGLRPGEALALEWGDIDLDARRIRVARQVRHGRVGKPKSGKGRPVRILPALAKVLAEFKLATGAQGKLFPAQNAARGGERGTPSKYLDPVVMSRKLGDALKACGLPAMTWYSAGRHTFASQHVIAGKSIEKLQKILGHSNVLVTLRYAHLAPEAFTDDDLMTFDHDLTASDAKVIAIADHRSETGAGGTTVGLDAIDAALAGG